MHTTQTATTQEDTKPGHGVFLRTLHPYLLTYSTEHSPSWKANRLSSSQEISDILLNPKVLYRFYKFPSPVPILSEINLA